MRGQRQSGLNVCHRRYAGIRKQAINFWKCSARVGPYAGVELPDQPCPRSACIAHDPGLRLRDIAVRLGITERTAHGVLTDLVQAGYVTKTKDGRRNHYQIQAHLPLPEPGTREPSIGELLAVLLGDTPGLPPPR
jgi:hypothetical protein